MRVHPRLGIELPPGPAPVGRGPLALAHYARRMRRALEVVGQRFEEYGDVYYAPFMGRDVYVLRDPAAIHEVLVEKSASFGKPVAGLTARLLRTLLGEGLLNSNGETWRRHRRLIQPAFAPAHLDRYAAQMAAFAEDARERFADGARVDLSAAMMELTLRIVAQTLFDHRVTSETDHVAGAMKVFRGSFGGVDALLPDWLPTPGRRRVQGAIDAIDRIVYGLIDERRARGGGDDLLSTLVAAGDDTAERLGRRQLRDEVLTLFLAGHETTSHALTWTYHLLSRHPVAEARMLDEIDAVLGGRVPTMADVASLPFTERVLSEAMRLYPPAYTVARVATEDVEVAGYTIPRGADVMVWIYHAHRHPRFHPEPARFDPDRFLPERKRAMPPGAYLPFGAGSRTCIGKRFAIVEAVLLLATLSQRVRFRPVPGHRVQLDAAVTLAPRGGLPVIVERRAPARTRHVA